MNTTAIIRPPKIEWQPSFQQVPGLNTQALDYKLLKNKP